MLGVALHASPGQVRQRLAQRELRWALERLACGDRCDEEACRQVAGDYLSFWLEHESGQVLGAGSIERYLLGWCEDPTDFVIDTLVALGRLVSR